MSHPGTDNPMTNWAADEDMVTNFGKMGFSIPEAHAYLALVQAQPATAYELAKISGLARATSYNAVAGLMRKGVIQPITSKPMRYVATSPERAFPAIAEKIADGSRALVAKIKEMTPAKQTDFVEVVEGRRPIEDYIRDQIREARQHLHVKTRDMLAKPFFDDLIGAAERGVSVTIVASGTQWEALMDVSGITVIAHEGTGSMPSDPHQILLTMTADESTAFVGALGDTPRGYLARNRTLVYVIRTMILHEIYLAE